ncbi:MAG: hypothetical protein GY778_09900, partial [bacterium]|nr:hypothetical protein [bacterium]
DSGDGGADEPVGTDGADGTGGGGPGGNQPPVAVASVAEAQTFSGNTVILDGSGSFDPDDGPGLLTYSWSQTGGTPVTGDPLFDARAAQPRFVAPTHVGNPDLDDIVFELVVSDGEDASAIDLVTVTVTPCDTNSDFDGDGTDDCADGCPADPAKTAPGECGCGLPDLDVDGDGVIDCDAPVAFDDHYYVFSDRQKYIGLRTLVDETVPGQLPALLDMSALTFAIETPPNHGQLLPAEPHATLAASLPSLRYLPDAGFAGQDSFTFTVTDSAGQVSNQATVRFSVGQWEVPLGLPEPSFGVREAHTMYAGATYNFQPRQVQHIQASGDDAAWSVVGGAWSSHTGKCPLIGDPGAEWQSFLRFPIRIPSGATIRRATLRFVVLLPMVGFIDQPAAIHLLDAVDMPDFTTNQSGRATLGPPAPWPIDLSTDYQNSNEIFTADISALLQTYIDQPGRQVGDAMGLKITRDSSAVPPAVWTLLEMRSWDSSAAGEAPLLTVVYEPAGHDPGQPYRIGTDGPYTHYVDFDAANAQDIDADGFFNFGTPQDPRLTIPTFLEAGSVVEVHGTTEVTDDDLRITGLVIGNQIGGTAASPIFVRGTRAGLKPAFRRPIEIRSNYIILENLHSSAGGSGAAHGNIKVRNTHRVDHDRAVDEGPIAFHHVALRHNAIRPPSGGANARLIDLRTYRDDADTAAHDIALYDNHLFDNGDWTEPTGSADYGGFSIWGNSHDVWVLGNHVHHMEGDAVGLPSENLSLGGLRGPASRIYIGRNHFHHCRENHIDGKLSQQVFISQNKLHTVMALGPGGSSGPQSLFFHHGGGQSDYVRAADEIWVMFNEIYDAGEGFAHTSNGPLAPQFPDVEARGYVIGNVIHHIWAGPLDVGYPISFGTHVAGRVINNTLYRCTRGVRLGTFVGTQMTARVRNNVIVHTETTGPQVSFSEGAVVDALERSFYDLDPAYNPVLRVRIHTTTYAGLDQLQAAGYGIGSIVGELDFVGARTADFRPQPGSPVIGAGDADYVYQLYFTRYGRNIRFDYNGVARPGNDVWDIGALQAGN